MTHRIFITGAGGYLGSAMATRLARAGHQVTGLVRHPARSARLAAEGVRTVAGDLAQPEGFVSLLRNCDVAIHAALAGQDPAVLDARALDLIRDAVTDGRVRRVLYTSGLWTYGDTAGRRVDETALANPLAVSGWRAPHEDAVLDLAHHGADVFVLQPALVYGGGRGILGALFASARDQGEVRIPGDGTQHWNLVHREDVAEACRLAVERPLPPARPGVPGLAERLLLTDGTEYTAGAVVRAVAQVTGVPAREWPRAEVVARLGAYGEALLASQRVSSAKARRLLGWEPRHTSFITGIEDIHREWQEAQAAMVR